LKSPPLRELNPDARFIFFANFLKKKRIAKEKKKNKIYSILSSINMKNYDCNFSTTT